MDPVLIGGIVVGVIGLILLIVGLVLNAKKPPAAVNGIVPEADKEKYDKNKKTAKALMIAGGIILAIGGIVAGVSASGLLKKKDYVQVPASPVASA